MSSLYTAPRINDRQVRPLRPSFFIIMPKNLRLAFSYKFGTMPKFIHISLLQESPGWGYNGI